MSKSSKSELISTENQEAFFSTNISGRIDDLRHTDDRNDELQQLVSNDPGFLVRWGLTLLFIILLIIGTVCWFIKSPEIVVGHAKLTSINSPKPVVTAVTGKLVKLSVKEGQLVKKGDIIGFMESTSLHDEVLKLSADIDSIVNSLYENRMTRLPLFNRHIYSNLGELQFEYQSYSQAWLNYKNYLLKGFYFRKKMMLKKDSINLLAYHSNLIKEKKLQQEDLALFQKNYIANTSLNQEKVLSDFDYRAEESRYINKELIIPQINTTILANEIAQSEKSKELLELENINSQQTSIYRQAVNTFKSKIDDWRKKYILTAASDGYVSFSALLQENQHLKEGETLCYVQPLNTIYYAEVLIPQFNFGKVAPGQLVLLKFESYPFEEYGAISGKLDFISRVPTDSGYLARVSLNEARTTYKKQIKYRDGLTANAAIITKDNRLLQRFYYTISKQFANY